MSLAGHLRWPRASSCDVGCRDARDGALAQFDVFIKIAHLFELVRQISHMQTLSELGNEVALRRRDLGLKQGDVARQAGIAQEMLSRFERGRCAEFGSRKLLAVLAVLGLELRFAVVAASGSLDDLRRERGGGV